MRIEQALYGEHRGGHSLLAASEDDGMSNDIVQRLDLPDTAPPGVEWSPFLRGFPFRNRYVLSRTFRDTNTSRGGMVFSHALLVPLDDIEEITDLAPLLQLLASSDRQRPKATTIDFVRTETPLPNAVDLIDAAEALAATGQYSRYSKEQGTTRPLPVVRLGHVGFDVLVVALWARLLPEMRRGFAFRLSFDPRDLGETPAPALVCTPPSMAARWSDYPIIRLGVSREPASLAAAVLSGHETAASLLGFKREIGAKPATFRDLRLLDRAYLLTIGEPTLDRCVGAVRLIEKLSSEPDAGEDGKDVLVRRLCELVAAATAEQILLLRNLRLSAFPSPNRVWKTLEIWVAENSYPRDQDGKVLTILEDATATATATAVEEWRTAVLDGLAIATRSRNSAFPKAFWRWFQVRPEVVAVVFRHVPAEVGVEKRVAAATPRRLDETATEPLATLALSRGWLRMHGAILSAIRNPLDAARVQIAVDTEPSFVEGLKSVLRQATPAEVVDCALEIEDPRMSRLAGEAVARDPRLLAEIDLTEIKAQVIWREALDIDPECWRAPADPTAAFHSILDSLLDGGDADPSLIERLSHAPIAELGSYSRRPETWPRIKGNALDNILTATASGWLRRAAGGGVPFAPEQALQSAILGNDEFESTLDALVPGRVGAALRVVATLDRYDEHRFLHLLESMMSRTTSLAASDAGGIGRLVLERQWEEVAADLAARYENGRRDLKPALRACYDMLDFWVRWRLWLTPIPETEKWTAFEELAAELYPGGPDDGGLWERAGGKDADLSSGGDGRTRWRNAMRNMRNGKGPTPSELLAMMLEDFPNNERLLHLAGDRVFGGSVLDSPGVKK